MLPGFKNGFIGGSTGLIDKEKWALAGDMRKLRSCEAIEDFLAQKVSKPSLCQKNRWWT